MIELKYLKNLQSSGEDIRRKYLDVIGFETPENSFKSLNEKLEISQLYNKNGVEVSENTVHVLFSVGNGLDSNIDVKDVEFSNDEVPVVTFVDKEDKLETEYGYNHLTSILPIRDFSVNENINQNYRIFRPIEKTNSWSRRFFTKECKTSKVVSVESGDSTNYLQVVCSLSKEDLNSLNPNDTISELCLYSGTLVKLYEYGRKYPSSYYLTPRPDVDIVDAYPILKVQFEPITVARATAYGLNFVLNINLKA